MLRAVALPADQKLSLRRARRPTHVEDFLDFVPSFVPAFARMNFAALCVEKHTAAVYMRAFEFANTKQLFPCRPRDPALLLYMHNLGLIDRDLHVGVGLRPLRDGGYSSGCRCDADVQ